MRRAALGLVLIGATARSHAEPWTVTAEAGGELDDNVQRVETGGTDTAAPVTAGVARLGAGIEHEAKLLGGAFGASAKDLTRIVDNSNLAVENVTVLAGNVQWLHGLADRPAAAGLALSAIDALPLSDEYGARTFRNATADAVLALRDGEDRSLVLSFGLRDFRYKPVIAKHQFDYWAPTASARLKLTLWQSPAKTRNLELVGVLGFEARKFYSSYALTDTCVPNAPPDQMCPPAGTDYVRRDRYQRAGVEVTWVGSQLANLGYELTVIDSNDYGQSLARHRINASGTMTVPGGVFVTLQAILQIDQYLDGLPVIVGDPSHMDIQNIQDENRSSVQLRVARRVVSQWSVEGRAAVWRNIAGGPNAPLFQRDLISIGVVYGK